MASTKPLERYSEDFPRLYFAAQLEPVIVDCGTPHAARLFRNELYAYRSALRKAADDDEAPLSLLINLFLAESITVKIAGHRLALDRHMWLQWNPLQGVL